MLQNEITPKKETTDNRQSGMEGLATAVIELAISDLKAGSGRSASAIHFFKNCPDLVEFWLAAAIHGGKNKLDIEIAKKELYSKAIKAEKLRAVKARGR